MKPGDASVIIMEVPLLEDLCWQHKKVFKLLEIEWYFHLVFPLNKEYKRQEESGNWIFSSCNIYLIDMDKSMITGSNSSFLQHLP